MIPRYEVKEVSELWSETARYQKLLDVERALLETLETKKRIPAHTARAFDHVVIKPERIQEIESLTRHDVIAFCTSITEQVAPESARYFHFGVTSSDVLDTALALQVKESIQIVMRSLEELQSALKKRINETQSLLCLGRSHGMAAEPMIFAQKFLSAQVELRRRASDYRFILESEMTGQFSGAVGNYTVLTPEIEEAVLKKLNLAVEPVSTQVIPRDRLAKVIGIGALTAVALERLAVEIRHLHHSDIAEVHEGFRAGQKGSSTMPHKKNPIASENITGLARVIRSHLEIALENSVLWHERDISHSSTERLYLPDHFGLLTYALQRMTRTIQDLEIHREAIEAKVKKNFATLSSFILHELIEKNSVARETLYSVVQKASFEANSLEDMLSRISDSLVPLGLNANLQGLNWDKIRSVYVERFAHVLNRAES